MKANFESLNRILFEQIETLNDCDLKGDELETQLKRSKGIVEVTRMLNDNAKLMLDACKLRDGEVVNVPTALIEKD